MANTHRKSNRSRKGGSRHIHAPTANNHREALMDAADEIMNKYGCGKATNLKKLDKCIGTLVDLYHDPNKTDAERNAIRVDLNILNRAYRTAVLTGGSKRRGTRRNRK